MITHNREHNFRKGDRVKVITNRWRTQYEIVSIDSPSSFTVKWCWWREEWVHIIALSIVGFLAGWFTWESVRDLAIR